LRHDEASQSDRPFSTSSTNRYLSFGRFCRNVSFSSEEFTVIVHTVFTSARATPGTSAAKRKGNSRERMAGTGNLLLILIAPPSESCR
jgi:hypothetical protein